MKLFIENVLFFLQKCNFLFSASRGHSNLSPMELNDSYVSAVASVRNRYRVSHLFGEGFDESETVSTEVGLGVLCSFLARRI